MCKIRFWQFRNCGGHIFPRKNASFGRFEVAFDRPEFDITQQCLLLNILCSQFLLDTVYEILPISVLDYYFEMLLLCALLILLDMHC